MNSLKKRVFITLNKLIPKQNKVLVIGNITTESNAIEIANFISDVLNKKVNFIVSKAYRPFIKKVVSGEVNLVQDRTIYAYLLQLTSRFVFSTHDGLLVGSTKRQIDVNIWHGLLYKNIRLLRNQPALYADITVGTSPLSQKMFSEAFGVSHDSVKITGYPRNDMMLRAKEGAATLKNRLGDEFNGYNKVIFWMPTFRRSSATSKAAYNLAISNPFEADHFDIKKFNALLKKNNALCILKPHYYYLSSKFHFEYSNIKLIDDKWILSKGLSLYEFLPLSDILISDFSSVIYDYMLLDKPIICFCTDLEDYKATQGLYFDNVEEWMPSKLFQKEEDFIEHLGLLLNSNADPYKEKRNKIKDKAFTYTDTNSSKRICEYVFKKN